MGDTEAEVEGRGGAVTKAPPDYTGLSLGLRVCPSCGRHGQVLVMHGGLVINTLGVLTRQEALDIHAELLRGGGQEQPEFLQVVAEADYLLSPDGSSQDSAVFGSMVAFGGVVMVFGGDVTIITSGAARDTRQTRRPGDDPLLETDLSQATLTLEQCSCRAHGVVVLKLPTGETYDLAFPTTKAEACHELEGLILRYRTLPDEQDIFLEAVRTADYLAGPMPVQLI